LREVQRSFRRGRRGLMRRMPLSRRERKSMAGSRQLALIYAALVVALMILNLAGYGLIAATV